MTKKTHTLAVKVATYTKDGQQKNRYAYIGAILTGKYGPFMLLEKTFNPAGVDCEGSQVKISMFPCEEEKTTPDVESLKSFVEDEAVPF